MQVDAYARPFISISFLLFLLNLILRPLLHLTGWNGASADVTASKCQGLPPEYINNRRRRRRRRRRCDGLHIRLPISARNINIINISILVLTIGGRRPLPAILLLNRFAWIEPLSALLIRTLSFSITRSYRAWAPPPPHGQAPPQSRLRLPRSILSLRASLPQMNQKKKAIRLQLNHK